MRHDCSCQPLGPALSFTCKEEPSVTATPGRHLLDRSRASRSRPEANRSSFAAVATEGQELVLEFGSWLMGLMKRVEVQELEIAELKERLARLEPIEAPLTPAQMCERYQIKRGTMRDWLFHRATNGLGGAVIRKGRRLYLDESSFLRWLRTTEPAKRRHVE